MKKRIFIFIIIFLLLSLSFSLAAEDFILRKITTSAVDDSWFTKIMDFFKSFFGKTKAALINSCGNCIDSGNAFCTVSIESGQCNKADYDSDIGLGTFSQECASNSGTLISVKEQCPGYTAPAPAPVISQQYIYPYCLDSNIKSYHCNNNDLVACKDGDVIQAEVTTCENGCENNACKPAPVAEQEPVYSCSDFSNTDQQECIENGKGLTCYWNEVSSSQKDCVSSCPSNKPANSQKICTTALTPVNGACGTPILIQQPTVSTSGLCISGTPASISASATSWTWTCQGQNQGINSGTCSASKQCNPDNSCAANTCTGQSCTDICGTSHQGTKTCQNLNIVILQPLQNKVFKSTEEINLSFVITSDSNIKSLVVNISGKNTTRISSDEDKNIQNQKSVSRYYNLSKLLESLQFEGNINITINITSDNIQKQEFLNFSVKKLYPITMVSLLGIKNSSNFSNSQTVRCNFLTDSSDKDSLEKCIILTVANDSFGNLPDSNTEVREMCTSVSFDLKQNPLLDTAAFAGCSFYPLNSQQEIECYIDSSCLSAGSDSNITYSNVTYVNISRNIPENPEEAYQEPDLTVGSEPAGQEQNQGQVPGTSNEQEQQESGSLVWLIWTISLLVLIGAGITVYILLKIRRKHPELPLESDLANKPSSNLPDFNQETQLKINQEVLDYVKKCRQLGFKDEQIKAELLKAGWDSQVIDSALK